MPFACGNGFCIPDKREFRIERAGDEIGKILDRERREKAGVVGRRFGFESRKKGVHARAARCVRRADKGMAQFAVAAAKDRDYPVNPFAPSILERKIPAKLKGSLGISGVFRAPGCFKSRLPAQRKKASCSRAAEKPVKKNIARVNPSDKRRPGKRCGLLRTAFTGERKLLRCR